MANEDSKKIPEILDTDRILFYQYGAKPIAEELQAFDGKVRQQFENRGFTFQEGFIAWQLIKLNKNFTIGFKESIHVNLLPENGD